MKTMFVKCAVFLLIAAMLFGVTAQVCGFAEEETPALGAKQYTAEDFSAAKDVIDKAIKGLQDIFPDERTATTAADVLSGAFSVISTGATIFAAINGGVAFLRLIGVMKDPNAEALLNIQTQLSIISDRLNEMDAKLDNITNEMTKFRAYDEYIKRTDAARDYRKAFSDFKTDYMIKALDQRIVEFDAKRVDAMKSWCRNTDAGARSKEGVDNTRVVLLYENAGDAQVVCSLANGVPSDFEGRVLILSSDFLPEHLDWNVNTYRESIVSYISAKIREAVNDGNFAAFESVGFPEFTEGGTPSDELIEQLASDAFDVIVYRALGAEVNVSSAFVKQVIKDYQDYCAQLTEPDGGVDAMLKTFYLTHTFEGEVSESITRFLDGMILQTACYNSFVNDLIGMSDSVTVKEAEDVVHLACDTFKTLGSAKKNALTGKDEYCYLTNSLLMYSDMTVTGSAQVETTYDGGVTAFVSSTMSSLNVRKWGLGHAQVYYNLIGDVPAQLMYYTLASNGITPNHDYFLKTIGYDAVNTGTIVTSISGEKSLGLDSYVPLRAYNILGSYFPAGYTFSLAGLPNDANSQYVVQRKQITGTVFNPSTGSVFTNQTLFAMAVYGESHWNWWTDEAAFLGGPLTGTFSGNYNIVCTKDYGKRHYQHNYDQSMRYNVIYSLPYTWPLQNEGDGYDPLSSYKELCAAIEEEFPRPEPPTGVDLTPVVAVSVVALCLAVSCAVAAVRRRRRDEEV